jgi:hypothetical protein
VKLIKSNTVGWIILVASLVFGIAVFLSPRSPRIEEHPNDRATTILPTQSQYLRDVTEPITMVEGIIWDNTSLGLVFKDSRQTPKYVCLLRLYEESDDPLKRNLLLGTALPHVQEGERIPVAGAVEMEFLGLLERWYRNDPEARRIAHRIETIAHRARAREPHPYYDQGRTEEYGGKVIAIEIMRLLRRRN